MIFKSRFSNKPTRREHSDARPRTFAIYSDRAEIRGASINLSELREFVESVQDWPGDAAVNVTRIPAPTHSLTPSRVDHIGITVTAKETE